MFVGVDALLGRYIRSFESENRKNYVDDVPAVLELIESLNRKEDLSDLEPSVQILLFSMVQAAKLRLNHNDPIRIALEQSDILGDLFLKILANFDC